MALRKSSYLSLPLHKTINDKLTSMDDGLIFFNDYPFKDVRYSLKFHVTNIHAYLIILFFIKLTLFWLNARKVHGIIIRIIITMTPQAYYPCTVKANLETHFKIQLFFKFLFVSNLISHLCTGDICLQSDLLELKGRLDSCDILRSNTYLLDL